MTRIAAATAALLATTSLAHADLSRTDQSVRLMFEDVGPSGAYAELSFGSVRPEAGFDSPRVPENPLANYTRLEFGYLQRLNDQFSLGVIYDQPFGAEIAYSPTGPFGGGNATVESDALTVIGRYEFGNGFSIHGGIRALEVSGSILTAVGGGFYLLDASSDTGVGYLVGAAYEIPDIALRVALTYNSAIDVSLDGTETNIAVAGAPAGTQFDVELPESINLEFQSGIAENTLLFGSIRHVFWDGFNLTTGVGEYVGFTSDTTTYTLGIGRQFNENWSGSISYRHQTSGTTPSDTALSPTTGLDSITLAAQYEQDNITVSGGITYGIPGDQVVISGAGPINVNDNEVVGVGIRVGFRF